MESPRRSLIDPAAATAPLPAPPQSDSIEIAGCPLEPFDVQAAYDIALSDPRLALPEAAGGGMLGAVILQRPSPQHGSVVAVLRIQPGHISGAPRLLAVESHTHVSSPGYVDPLSTALDARDTYLRNLVHYVSTDDIAGAVETVSAALATGSAAHLVPKDRWVSYFTVGGYDSPHPCCADSEPMLSPPMPPAGYNSEIDYGPPEWCCSSCGDVYDPEIWVELDLVPFRDSGFDQALTLMPQPDLAASALDLLDAHWLRRHLAAIDEALHYGIAISERLSAGNPAAADVVGYLSGDTLLTDDAQRSLQTILTELETDGTLPRSLGRPSAYSPQWSLDPHAHRVHCHYTDHNGHMHASGYSIEPAHDGLELVGHFPTAEPAAHGLHGPSLTQAPQPVALDEGLSLN